ncbi:MAG: NAD(+) synthase [Defluviitaleaceae bacterium]|nr:NAD(+) synthase [Defluviitaleaceae bacterium]
MRNYEREKTERVKFIQNVITSAKVNGVVFANSGGKDAALVGILCKMACDNTIGLSLPCGVKRNYGSDLSDAELLSQQFGITNKTISLTQIRDGLTQAIDSAATVTETAIAYLAPRLRMVTLYAIANSENRLVAGTSNLSEIYTGYSTKWGDGAYDFNPIADLTATEVLEFLRFFGAPGSIIEKAPSAGLFEGQTDEAEMGITYASLDKFLLTGQTSKHDEAIINRLHSASEHKRKPPIFYGTISKLH